MNETKLRLVQQYLVKQFLSLWLCARGWKNILIFIHL